MRSTRQARVSNIIKDTFYWPDMTVSSSRDEDSDDDDDEYDDEYDDDYDDEYDDEYDE